MPSKRSKNQAKKYLSPEQRKGKTLLPPRPYRSWLEADVANNLRKRRIKFEYEPSSIVYVEPSKTRRYIPDLVINGGCTYIEVKGRWTAHDRRKMGYVIEQNPDLDIRMLFAKDNTISKNSKTRYSDWCEKRGIMYAIGTEVPKEWIK